MLDKRDFSREELDAAYKKLEDDLMNDRITPDEHITKYNTLMKLENQPFGPPQLHEHI